MSMFRPLSNGSHSLTIRAQRSETVVHFSTGKTVSMSAE